MELLLPLYSLIPFAIMIAVVYFVVTRVDRMLSIKREQNDLLKEIIKKMDK